MRNGPADAICYSPDPSNARCRDVRDIDIHPGGHAKWVQSPHGPATVSGQLRFVVADPDASRRGSDGRSLGADTAREDRAAAAADPRVRTPGHRGRPSRPSGLSACLDDRRERRRQEPNLSDVRPISGSPLQTPRSRLLERRQRQLRGASRCRAPLRRRRDGHDVRRGRRAKPLARAPAGDPRGAGRVVSDSGSVTGRCTWETYDRAFSRRRSTTLAADGITHVIFGDILFDEHRQWAERMCAGVRADRRRAALGLIDRSAASTTGCPRAADARDRHDARRASRRQLARPAAGRDLLPEFARLGVDPCGERGEYHTAVVDTPLFSSPLCVRENGRVQRSDCWALDLLPMLTRDRRSRSRTATAAVLHGVSLNVERGDLVGLLGPNGSGKTTLLETIAGTLSPNSGDVMLERPAADAMDPARHRAAPRLCAAGNARDRSTSRCSTSC